MQWVGLLAAGLAFGLMWFLFWNFMRPRCPSCGRGVKPSDWECSSCGRRLL